MRTDDHSVSQIHTQAAEALAEAKRELVRVFEAMPRDLQQTMLSAPRRAAMLHTLRTHTKVTIVI